ncbi:hypothetical protein JHK85_008475 [Glycine max]|nr:hypothetical protein JHK85_008475 [Glycine max]
MSVIRTKRGLVKPAELTPLTTVLDLSAIDRLPVLRCNARTLHVFKHGPEATRVIREALSKALVPYYPLAGRLKESKPVEASSDCTLRSVNFFDDVHSIPYDHLLPDAIPESQCIHPLVQIQVTEFGCGGSVIGLIFCHCICDGLGAADSYKKQAFEKQDMIQHHTSGLPNKGLRLMTWRVEEAHRLPFLHHNQELIM